MKTTQKLVFYLSAPTHSLHVSHKISKVTGPKLTNFLSDVEASSSMLTQQLALRYSHRLLNASAQYEDRVCQFSPHVRQIGYHSNVP